MSLDVIQKQLVLASNRLDLNSHERALLDHRTGLAFHDFGAQDISGQDVWMIRAHSGMALEDEPGIRWQGGLRAMYDPSFRTTLGMLGMDMTLKFGAHGLTTPDKDGIYINGGKGFIMGDVRKLGPAGIVQAIERFAQQMYDRGLHTQSGVAGDMNTNGLVGKYYPAAIRRYSNDTYDLWRATASGKDPLDGGNPFRPEATGYGVYAAQQALLERRGLTNGRKLSVGIQGSGNVSGWYAYYAGQDKDLGVQHMSDTDGTFWTPDPAGFELDREMVMAISDNPAANGKRAQLYYQALQKKYGDKLDIRFTPDCNAIFDQTMDVFMPAANKYSVNEENCRRPTVKVAVIEGGNDALDPVALAHFEAQGVDVLSGFVANSAGGYLSVDEIKTNIIQAKPNSNSAHRLLSRDASRSQLQLAMKALVNNTLDTADKLSSGGKRLPILDAATALAVNNLVRYHN